MNHPTSRPIECDPAAPSLEDKVAFLKQAASYPFSTGSVEAVETHMAWVFLTDQFAFKLKKPVRYPYLDFSTLAARRVDSYREVRLNRRLSADVYLGVVPLVLDSANQLRLDAPGSPVDWLVQMRRLSRDRMLDRALSEGGVEDHHIASVAELIGRFHRQSPPIARSGQAHCVRLNRAVERTRQQLLQADAGLSAAIIRRIAASLQRFIKEHGQLLHHRVEAGYLIDAHGDLRPEHICLEDPPVIIDCLEFNRDFRLLDPASEFSFLTLECDRLGAPAVSTALWDAYLRVTGDSPSRELLRFYRGDHAYTRARIAIAHLQDSGAATPEKWLRRTEDYLRFAVDAVS